MFALLDAHSSSTSAVPVHWAPAQHIQVPSSCVTASNHQQPLLSVLDALAAPTIFMQQALVFAEAISAEDLANALQLVLQGYPALGYRLSKDQDDRLSLCSPPPPAAASITYLQGTSPTTLQQLLQHSSTASSCLPAEHSSTPEQTTQQQQSVQHPEPHKFQQQQQQQLVKLPELPNALFGHLPGALLPDYLHNAELSLVHVALVQLAAGGCVVGLRMSHLMGDWSSARLLLRSIATAYSHTQLQQLQQQQDAVSVRSHSAVTAQLSAYNTSRAAAAAAVAQLNPAGGSSSSKPNNVVLLVPHLTPAAPLLNQLVAATRQQMRPGFVPVRLKLQQPEDEQLFQQLAQLSSSSSESNSDKHASSGQPQRLTYHVLPDRIQQLKQQALADLTTAAAAGPASDGSSSSSRACTSHNVLLARLLQAFCSLPGRAGVPHDVAVSVDMRGRLPLTQQQQQALTAAFGNFFASAILEDALPCGSSLGELAVQLRAAVDRGGELWLPDLAWASCVMGSTDAATTDHQYVQQLQQQRVTWHRLHAMGSRKLLQQQMQLGLLASLSTTQWLLDYAADAYFAGQMPLMAVPSFSQPQPYPLLLMQQAPQGSGGGMLLHVWLDAGEVELLQQAVAASGGL